MIEFYPDNLKMKDFESPGEFTLYQKFKEYSKFRDWIVYHSQDVHKHVSQYMGEIDFIIVVPKLGVLTVEVKACKTLVYDPKLTKPWKLGVETPEKRGPFKQARYNRQSLSKFLIETYPVLSDVIFWDVVVFTDLNFSTEKNIAWNRWEYINKNQIENVAPDDFLKLFENVLETAFNENKNKLPVVANTPNYNHLEIIKRIRKKIEIYQDPKLRREKKQKELLKVFNENQLSILNQLDRNPQCIIEGPAGTGKTLLAIEMAKRNALQRKQTLFLCFNSLFGDYLKNIINNINKEVGEKIIHFFTSTSFYMKICQEKAYDEKSDIKYLKTRAIDKLLHNEDNYFSGRYTENLIIDEFQDILKEDDIEILDLIYKDGLKKIPFYLFGDFYYQNIQNFERDTSVDDFRKKYPCTIVPINENCRNSPDVIVFSEKLCGFNPYQKYLRDDIQTRPKIEKYQNDFDQLIKLDDIIEKLLNEKYQPMDIKILSMKKISESCLKYINFLTKDYTEWAIWGSKEENDKYINNIYNKHKEFYEQTLLSHKNFIDDYKFKFLNFVKPHYSPHTSEKYLYYTTIRKFKGLESDIVIIVDLDDINDEDDKLLLHTGITRCTDRIFVLMQKDVKLL